MDFAYWLSCIGKEWACSLGSRIVFSLNTAPLTNIFFLNTPNMVVRGGAWAPNQHESKPCFSCYFEPYFTGWVRCLRWRAGWKVLQHNDECAGKQPSNTRCSWIRPADRGGSLVLWMGVVLSTWGQQKYKSTWGQIQVWLLFQNCWSSQNCRLILPPLGRETRHQDELGFHHSPPGQSHQ